MKRIVATLVLFLFGCGGGSGNTPLPITANAGPDKSVVVGSAVEIMANQSEDLHKATYQWTLLSSPTKSNVSGVTYEGKNISFVADTPGQYVFQLKLTNNNIVTYDNVNIYANYNVVVILTDDQRWDTIWAMPILNRKLASKGIVFTNSYSTTPVCCPFRASFLSCGFYPKNTGVLTNDAANGGMSHFNESNTLATTLEAIGYSTGFVGKYLHGYYPGYFPAGWSSFVANENGGMLEDWYKLKNVTFAERGIANYVSVEPIVDQYLTNFETNEAIKFFNKTVSSNNPFFLYLAYYAPHYPASPDSEDKDLFKNYFYKDRSVGEVDLSDKPIWVRDNNSGQQCEWLPQMQLRSLQSVDRGVGDIIDWLETHDQLKNTIVIFTSDNGLMYGEHGLCDKGWPYEESLKVPLIVLAPNILPGSSNSLVAVNLDVPATILDYAGLPIDGDGLSLKSTLNGDVASLRESLYLEAYRYIGYKYNTTGLWAGYRTIGATGDWKYIEHGTGEIELYNLVNDPFEMNNLSSDIDYQQIIAGFSNQLSSEKGLSIATLTIPPPVVNQEYSYRIPVWGGQGPLVWNVVQGQLPAGLDLDPGTGTISGIPLQGESSVVSICVTSNNYARHAGKRQKFVQQFTIDIEDER